MCRKMSEDAWTSVCSVFDALPVAARVGGRILCMHGGISPQLRELSDINAIQRPTALDTEDGGLLTDLVWSDPSHAAPGELPCIYNRPQSRLRCQPHAYAVLHQSKSATSSRNGDVGLFIRSTCTALHSLPHDIHLPWRLSWALACRIHKEQQRRWLAVWW